GQNPSKSAEVIGWVKGATGLPVIVKVTPNITDISPLARAAQAAGVDAISAINTAKCVAGVDLETLTPYPIVGGLSSYGGYSGPGLKPIALRFIAEMASDPELRVPLSGIGGISTWSDAAEFILLGASTVQVATAVMQRGYRIIEELVDGLRNFMERKGFASVEPMVGLSLPKLTQSGRLSRAYRVVSSVNREACIGCGRCYISCRDGAYDAIEIGPDRVPAINEEKCEGCALCSLVCPVDDCIKMVRREDRAGFFEALACSVENRSRGNCG
ncbi:MAG: NAD-dependent dihydropyrimidine dehydrogenase subunit PreA, partial [Actinobacteria bacterium]|nr:NAD-dependent dihydropyrimidine dehydrogenase subunit PreA [Actinomycetota bacterium]